MADAGNHLEIWEAEKLSENAPGDRAWFAYVRAVERLTGKPPNSLDADEGDGFSIDAAYRAFEAGETAGEHIEDILANGSPFPTPGDQS